MTEVPEDLLRRARAAREKSSGLIPGGSCRDLENEVLMSRLRTAAKPGPVTNHVGLPECIHCGDVIERAPDDSKNRKGLWIHFETQRQLCELPTMPPDPDDEPWIAAAAEMRAVDLEFAAAFIEQNALEDPVEALRDLAAYIRSQGS